MRGLMMIGVLVALVVVGYLQVKSSRDALAPSHNASQDVTTRTEEVQKEVDAAMKQHMDKLKQYEQQTQ